MKGTQLTLLLKTMILSIALCGCCRSSDEVWDDTKSCSRHVSRGFCTLGGKRGDSRAVRSRDQFYAVDPNYCGEDFIPLQDDAFGGNGGGMDLMATPPPMETPGDPGSSVPGIEAFRDPSIHPQIAGIFRNIHFEYNQHLVKGDENMQIVHRIAEYMRNNPNVYIFVEGHCDERGPEAFNLALGSRRANSVRDLLVNAGVNPNNIFTISYGKERPLVLEHHDEAWSANRRAEFKVYQQ